jgi:hypothetical protein
MAELETAEQWLEQIAPKRCGSRYVTSKMFYWGGRNAKFKATLKSWFEACTRRLPFLHGPKPMAAPALILEMPDPLRRKCRINARPPLFRLRHLDARTAEIWYQNRRSISSAR